MLTPDQIIAQTKTVTRRTGWANLKPGTLVRAVRKGMGLKKGEKVEPICVIRVVNVRREPLMAIVRDRAYGLRETRLEGFPNGYYHIPAYFAIWFAKGHGIGLNDDVTRIEFEYVNEKKG